MGANTNGRYTGTDSSHRSMDDTSHSTNDRRIVTLPSLPPFSGPPPPLSPRATTRQSNDWLAAPSRVGEKAGEGVEGIRGKTRENGRRGVEVR